MELVEGQSVPEKRLEILYWHKLREWKDYRINNNQRKRLFGQLTICDHPRMQALATNCGYLQYLHQTNAFELSFDWSDCLRNCRPSCDHQRLRMHGLDY
jgi:hypothetical protein